MQLFTRLVIVSKVKQGSVEKKCGSKLDLVSRFSPLISCLTFFLQSFSTYFLCDRK